MFKCGDIVEWTSHATCTTTKVGKIVFVIPPYADFLDVEKMLSTCLNFSSQFGGGMARDHETYAVLVPCGAKKKPKLYWPRSSQLKMAPQEALHEQPVGFDQAHSAWRAEADQLLAKTNGEIADALQDIMIHTSSKYTKRQVSKMRRSGKLEQFLLDVLTYRRNRQ